MSGQCSVIIYINHTISRYGNGVKTAPPVVVGGTEAIQKGVRVA